MLFLLENRYLQVVSMLDGLGVWLPGLLLRVILAWEFGEAGWVKLHGENWFADLSFPFPFNLLPADVNWNIAMSFELLGALALILGMFTRFFSLSLMVVTVVAIVSVHWPEHRSGLYSLLLGYRFEDVDGDGLGNYKLPLLYLVMLLPLLCNGAGRLSVDACLSKVWKNRP